ncbi:MAG: 4Fe-4S ferredoxin [Firmicutes bacterium]|nr:4Fe-4S ferredoxin [Bacillota bacterium]
MLKKTGIPTMEDIKSVFPNEDRINEGPVAVIECYQRIPCNPCSTSCLRDAIQEFNDINDTPSINDKNCNGCGMCISACPGLAIIVIDGSYSDEEVLFKIPYEFLPLPNKGDIVKGLNRAGEYITDVKVIKVQNPKSFDKTPIVHLAVNRDFLYQFRNIKVEEV